TSMERCRKPVLAAIHGACVGGGIDLITCTDMRYCSAEAYFTIKEIDIGMTADVGTATLRAVWGTVTLDKVYTISRSRQGVQGNPGANAQLLALLASAQAFTFNGAGVATPGGQVVTLSAVLSNLAGTATFSATGYDASGTSLGALSLGGSGNSRTLSVASFGAAVRAVVQATLGAFSDQVTLVRLRDGTAGSDGQNTLSGYLTNESHTVGTAVDGTGGNYATAGGDFKVFNGTTELTSGVTFSVVDGTVVGITGLSIGSDGIYSLTGTTADVGTATLRAVVGAVTIDKVYSISRSKAGGGLFTWVVSGGCQGDGTTLRRVAGAGAWDSQGYSAESYVGGAYASARAGRTDGSMMFGLNSDPAADASYTSLDFAWYFTSGGSLDIWESGTFVATFGSYTTDTVLSVVYDGKTVRYLKDGVVVRALPVAPGLRLHLDTSLFELGTVLNGVVFGPSGARGDDGLPANKLVRAYIRSATPPSTPTGGGIPSGWSAAPPAANGLPLYMSESTQTPADVLVVSWSDPVKADATAAPGPVAQIGTLAVVATSGSSTALASLAFKSNGTITGVRNSGGPVVQAHYYFPTTVGIGTGLYVNVVRESGNTLDGASSALNTWLELTSDRTYQLSRSTTAIARTSLSFLIASDPAGVNIVGAGNMTLDVVRE
ncbi:MAG: enoyl-CoA hydratase-related protein, partial [Rubrivivax sp.]|nr:enoyl-CoA hydratase-related protein [Rubrivivax sp.]